MVRKSLSSAAELPCLASPVHAPCHAVPRRATLCRAVLTPPKVPAVSAVLMHLCSSQLPVASSGTLAESPSAETPASRSQLGRAVPPRGQSQSRP